MKYAIAKLVEEQRLVDSIDLLANAVMRKCPVESETLLLPVEALTSLVGEAAVRESQRIDSDGLGAVISALQSHNDVAPARLIQIEWLFMPILDRHSGRPPKALHRLLCESPKFFIELLQLHFRPKGEPDTQQPPVEEKTSQWRASQCRNAYSLLHDWDLIPGTATEGCEIDEGALRSWCDEARQLARECGQLGICDDYIGQLFATTPIGADFARPCQPVRHVIEAIATEALSDGLICGIRNSRGTAFRGSGGEQERVLAEKYRLQAEAIMIDAPFTAGVLTQVAQSYEYEARRWDEDDRWRKR